MSSSAYDPRRSRPRPTPIPDPEAAPIDALLGPEPSAELPDARTTAPQTGDGRAQAPRPTPGSRSGAPSPLLQLAPLLALGALVAVLVWWLTRRRGAPS